MTRATEVAEPWSPDLAPHWAQWQPSAPYSLGIEEEVMLVDPSAGMLAQRIDDVLGCLPGDLSRSVGAETHQGAIELATDPHATVGGAVGQLAELRARLSRALATLDLRAAAAGTHPMAVWTDTRVSLGSRYRVIHSTMRDLACREPTFAMHVHVGVSGPDAGVALLNRLRAHLPMFLALSANSPFWQGRDTGFASSRTFIFQAFPRTGMPRRFSSYDDWRGAVDVLLRSGAMPEPTFLWWDVRLQPALGTVEVRIMDTQTTSRRTTALAALVQSVARLELEQGYVSDRLIQADEVLAENRFLAARDGVHALLIEPERAIRRPLSDQVREVLQAARPHAAALGCTTELEAVEELLVDPAPEEQRVGAARGGLYGVVASLCERFDEGSATP